MITSIVAKLNLTSYEDSSDCPVNLAFTETYTKSLATGTGSGNADQAVCDTRTLGSGANEDLDLAGGISRGGYAYTFTKIKAIMIEASTANTTNVDIKTAAANGWAGPFADPSDIIEIPPGGVFLMTEPLTGWTVTAGTGDLLNIADGGAAGVTYTITLVGEGSIA